MFSDCCPVCNLFMEMEPDFEDLDPCVCNICGELVHPGCMEAELGEWCLNCDEKEEG